MAHLSRNYQRLTGLGMSNQYFSLARGWSVALVVVTLWALEHVRKPASGSGRYDRVWQQVRDVAGTYEMRP